jgi:hypothetical protein
MTARWAQTGAHRLRKKIVVWAYHKLKDGIKARLPTENLSSITTNQHALLIEFLAF